MDFWLSSVETVTNNFKIKKNSEWVLNKENLTITVFRAHRTRLTCRSIDQNGFPRRLPRDWRSKNVYVTGLRDFGQVLRTVGRIVTDGLFPSSLISNRTEKRNDRSVKRMGKVIFFLIIIIIIVRYLGRISCFWITVWNSADDERSKRTARNVSVKWHVKSI